jgi:hypothetical protein
MDFALKNEQKMMIENDGQIDRGIAGADLHPVAGIS